MAPRELALRKGIPLKTPKIGSPFKENLSRLLGRGSETMPPALRMPLLGGLLLKRSGPLMGECISFAKDTLGGV